MTFSKWRRSGFLLQTVSGVRMMSDVVEKAELPVLRHLVNLRSNCDGGMKQLIMQGAPNTLWNCCCRGREVEGWRSCRWSCHGWWPQASSWLWWQPFTPGTPSRCKLVCFLSVSQCMLLLSIFLSVNSHSVRLSTYLACELRQIPHTLYSCSLQCCQQSKSRTTRPRAA